jgi:hypothetical protein
MAVKKRCNFCLKPLRPDGTCQNPECPRYVPEPEEPKPKKKSKGGK